MKRWERKVMSRSYKGIRLKKHRVYSVEDLMIKYGVVQNTVSNWVRSGLSPSVSGRRYLFRGADVEEFHRARRQRGKTQLRESEFYCTGCKLPVLPDPDTLGKWPNQRGADAETAVCPECHAGLWKFISRQVSEPFSPSRDPNTKRNRAHEENTSVPGGIGIDKGIKSSPNDTIIYVWQSYAGKHSEKTIDRHLTSIRYFEELVGNKPFDELTLADCHKMRDVLKAALLPGAPAPMSKSSVQHIVSHLKDFLRWLRKQEGFKRLPADLPDGLDLPRAAYAKSLPREQRLYPPLEEAENLLSAMPDRTIGNVRARAIFALAFLTAMRADTLVSLRIRDVDVSARRVTQDGQKSRSKNGKSLVVAWFPVPGAFSKEVANWVDCLAQGGFELDDPLFPPASAFEHRRKSPKLCGTILPVMTTAHAVSEAFKIACKGHQSVYTPHAAKHTIAAERDLRNLNAEQRKAWSVNMGHDDEVVTTTYYGKMNDDRRLELMSTVGKNSPVDHRAAWSDEEKIRLFDAVLEQAYKR